MVDALISFTIEKLVDKGVELGEDELKLLCGTREEVHKLSSTLQNMIRPCLHDAEMRQFYDPDVRDWLKELKYVAYEADDVLDEWQSAKSQQLWSRQLSSSANLVWNFFAHCTCFRQLALRHTVGKKIQKINSKLDHINDTQNKKFKFMKSSNVMGEEANFLSVIRNDRQTDSLEENMFGRVDEIERIKDKLMNSSDETSKVAVVSIVGSAGFGKTTLAKRLINDIEVKQYFQQQIWVCVSDQFDVTSIMKKMIEAAKGDSPSAGQNQEALQKKIADEVLKDKLFLLVLDDVWNENFGKWEKLFNIIKNCGLRGSRILVTTRNENVCRVMGSAHMMFQLEPLTPENCWSIFENVAFENRDESERPELRMVGEEIVKKCKGIPLAIKTVAGVLRTKSTREAWDNVLKSDMWDWQPISEMGIFPALFLSYYHLTPQLKQCFRYCAIYPKDEHISKDEIVLQWIAHGYINSKENNMEMEDVGEIYFDELVARCLFQELYKRNNSTYCKIHDLVHDLALFVTNKEFLYANEEENFEFDPQNPPRHCNVSNMDKIDVGKFLKLHTFMSTSFEKEVCTYDNQIEEMRHLRVLSVLEFHGNYWRPHVLPDVVGKLIHLRYLHLFGENIQALPRSIGKLQNLYYLRFYSKLIEALPESVGMLRKLRHLDLTSNENLKALPSTIGKLTDLRKLELSGTRLDEIPCSIGELQNLLYLDLSENKNLKALPSMIGRLTNLRKLYLKSTGFDEIPDCIGELASLEVLDVFGCENLEKLPESIKDLSHLQVLNVSCCKKLEQLPESIKDLSRLQVLNVSNCTKLEQLPAGIFDKMTGLKELKVWSSSLQGLPAGIGKLTHLQSLDKFWVLGSHEDEEGSSSSSSVPSSNICELRDLNHLHGFLAIHNLDIVASGEEAASAQLHKKNSLTDCLRLFWNTDGPGGAKEETTSEDVLQALRPCPTLPLLWIHGYPGRKVPTWLGDSTTLMLSGLRELELDRWDGCTNLSGLGNLPELRRLEIWNMPKVRRVGAEWLGSNHGFPRLEVLEFRNMAEWEEWDSLEEKPFFTFPCLSELDIWDCPKLRSLPPIFSTSLLREIKVNDCPNLSNWLGILPPSVVSLPSISAEWVNEMPSLPNLEHLTISGDDGVLELSKHLVKVGSLKKLMIKDCPNLESLPQEMASLKQLQELEISNCGKLRSLPSLPNLEELTFGGDDGVSELSNDLVNKLDRLKLLGIGDCANLESLPQEMDSLKQLQILTIWNCPKLKESCNEDGAEWYKIQRIPTIRMDFYDVRRNADQTSSQTSSI